MPGPLGTIAPTTDPNWAWDTPGWTNQGNTQDVEGQNLSAPGQGSMLIEPAALSGYIARTMDPDVTTIGGTGTNSTSTSQTCYLAAVQVLEPVTTGHIAYYQTVAGVTSPHFYMALYSATTGVQVAVTADQGAGAATTFEKVAWTTAVALSPGYYWVLRLSNATTTQKVAAYTLSAESQGLLSGTSVLNYTVGTSLRFAIGGTGLTSLATPPAVLTSSMVVSADTQSWFAGLY
jgi:hypothetical protein